MLTKNDLEQIKEIVNSELSAGLKPIKKDIKKIREDINMIVDHFDRERFLKIPPLTT